MSLAAHIPESGQPLHFTVQGSAEPCFTIRLLTSTFYDNLNFYL